jgi:hypothetical protein
MAFSPSSFGGRNGGNFAAVGGVVGTTTFNSVGDVTNTGMATDGAVSLRLQPRVKRAKQTGILRIFISSAPG